ncbi:LytR C-terminal domain-containing protein [Compostimonas suwonensis]|uniref:LytR cell envelope-related transcriptional attenuator n=1 Tax=Compostimonas suwonensis TaxID=1048394 RepID=A0A2M9BVI3_9MICO|nr:LytR C-terminal domain-containing protein [Compostimonas suwonensis]PJJ61969.1 LytR cell envelope-related transcriptional attenuator [Compostimonas suwonensis]
MAASFPKDRFDLPTEHVLRVGAHRTPRKKGRGWIAFAWAALATVILIAVGVVGIFVINDRVSFDLPFTGSGTPTPTESATPTPTIVPVVDPALAVTVLNGTATEGLATRVGDTLTAAGWTVGSRTNASAQDVATTTVYYSDPANAGAALGLAQSLGLSTIVQSDDFADSGANLVVVIGADYVEPVTG